jgi:hypothetical protein
MGRELATYPSKSSPGKKYTIFKSDDGSDTYCDCWQWKRNKTCSHLRDYLNNIPGVSVPVVPVSMSTDCVLSENPEDVIDNIIN